MEGAVESVTVRQISSVFSSTSLTEVCTLPSVAAASCHPLIGDCSFVCLVLSLMKWILWRILATHFIKYPKFRFLWCCLMIRLKLFLARTTQKWWFALLPWDSELVMLIQNSQLVLYFRNSQLCNYSYRLYNGQTFHRNIFKCTSFIILSPSKFCIDWWFLPTATTVTFPF